MKKLLLLAMAALCLHMSPVSAQCPVTPPSTCIPISTVPVINGIVTLDTGQDYCISGSTVINGTINATAGNTLYNSGDLQATGLIVQTPGGLVLCPGSTITVDSLTLGAADAITAPTTGAQLCILVNNYLDASVLQNNLTGDVHFCINPSATVLNGSNLASASVNTNCTNCAVALPIHFIDLKCAERNGAAYIEWQAYEDDKAIGYKVQRMQGGGAFEDIGYMAAKHGPGENNYSFSQPAPAGRTYYRIAIVDLTGTTYSPVRSIAGNSVNNRYIVHYGANAMTFVSAFDISKPLAIDVFDAAGHKLQSLVATEGSIHAGMLSAGIYFIRAVQGPLAETSRLVVRE